jgi:hypothetical protein
MITVFDKRIPVVYWDCTEIPFFGLICHLFDTIEHVFHVYFYVKCVVLLIF